MSFLDSIGDFVTSAANTLAGGVEDAASTVGDFASTAFGGFGAEAFDVLQGCAAPFLGLAEDAGSDLLHDITHPGQFFSDAGKAIASTASDVADGFVDLGKFLGSEGSFVLDVAENTASDLLHDVTHPGQFFSDAGKAIASAASDVAAGIGDGASAVANEATWAASTAEGIASDAWDDIKSIF